MTGISSNFTSLLTIDQPILQSFFAAIGTFVWEDPTSVGCGLLVADGRMAFLTAWVGLTVGIALGDLGLYALGRFFGSQVIRWGFVSDSSLVECRQRFGEGLFRVVLLSRFVPGMRLPTYTGAGVLRADLGTFLLIVVLASVVWTTALLSVTATLGAAALPLLGSLRWPVFVGVLGSVAVYQWSRGRGRRTANECSDARAEPVTSSFEFWHPAFFYIPVAIYYFWLALRYRGLLLPTAANPQIFSGGMVGESKSSILDLVTERARVWVAKYATLTNPSLIRSRGMVLDQAEEAIESAGFSYPLVAKPDIGQRGAGVKLLRNSTDLIDYVNQFPEGQKIVFQEYIDYPHEAGVLYYRLPGTERGILFSITLKVFPSVVGDGSRTLRELIEADPRASKIKQTYFARHRRSLDTVLTKGKTVPLVFAGNHAQGCIFKDGARLATPDLLDRIEEIARSIPDFYFGRFDLRFVSEEMLKRGEGFRIVEINGAGAEATHIWDANMSLKEAYQTLFNQFDILFQIGSENRRRGCRPLKPIRFIQEFLKYQQISRHYPLTD